ncbi:hypothetical protein CLU79DRAFT_730759 [Phycomyces nitens]|nr:hypothetical protein CLU79DRAFT_730759 [Phycomyces nitens]
MRSATTKCLIFQGFPTTINASSSLYEILSPKVKSLFNKDNLCYRDDTTMGELYERGYKIFSNVYKERSDGVAAYMTAENPDLFNHSIYMYAVVIGNYTHLSALETHFVMVVNLLLKESNIQLENHLENFIGLGGTSDQLKDIKTIVEVIKAL